MSAAPAPTEAEAVTIPEGFSLHTENSARILLPATQDAFLNPVQEFNRDLSVACITVWSELLNEEREARWRTKMERQAQTRTQGGGGAGKGQAKKRKPVADGNATAYENDSRTSTTGIAASDGATNSTAPPDVDMIDSIDAPVASDAPTSTADASITVLGTTPTDTRAPEPKPGVTPTTTPKYTPHTVAILEALSATGLRAIRYARELPLVRYVIANDLSPAAVTAIQRNVALNGLESAPHVPSAPMVGSASVPTGDAAPTIANDTPTPALKRTGALVRINEGDACALMYAHRADRLRVDCVDVDPYGTAAPFLDAAVQCVTDGGLLCVTCTDLSVLATNNYPEKCFANYGGVPVKAEYCHEVALRLVLHAISTSAARYGRYIHPLLSLSIDFYVRLFVRVRTAPVEVKKAASNTATFYICASCQASFAQPLGKLASRAAAKSGAERGTLLYGLSAGPPVGAACPECGGTLHVAGPMWAGPIHDRAFAARALAHVEASKGRYGTEARMRGMLTVAGEELDAPFYFTPSRVAGHFHCVAPPLEDIANALLHAGHAVSRAHALAGSLKTDAPRRAVHDVFRAWVRAHPVKPESIAPGSPAAQLHAREPSFEANFSHHPLGVTPAGKVKLVRYQQNPTAGWGPGSKPGRKRKRADGEGGAEEGGGC